MDRICLDLVEVEYISGWINWRYKDADIRHAKVGGTKLAPKEGAEEITFGDVLELAILKAKKKAGIFNRVDEAIAGCEFGPEYQKAVAEGTVSEMSNTRLWHVTQLLCIGSKIPYRIGLTWSWRQIAPTHSGLAVLDYEFDLAQDEARLPIAA